MTPRCRRCQHSPTMYTLYWSLGMFWRCTHLLKAPFNEPSAVQRTIWSFTLISACFVCCCRSHAHAHIQTQSMSIFGRTNNGTQRVYDRDRASIRSPHTNQLDVSCSVYNYMTFITVSCPWTTIHRPTTILVALSIFTYTSSGWLSPDARCANTVQEQPMHSQ